MGLKFTVSKKSLLEGLSSLQSITSKRSTLAILTNFLVESTHNGVVLTVTDLEVGLQLFISANVEEPGEITLPSKKVFEIVRESGPHDITIEESDNNWVVVKAGLSTYNLAGTVSDEFPEFPEYDKDNFFSFNSHTFLDLIDKVVHSIANEQENVYSLTSVLFEKEEKDNRTLLRMVSSDGHRLSIMEKDITIDISAMALNNVTLIPKKGIHELKKFCENRDTVEISFEKKQMVVRDGQTVMIVRLKQGEFPQHRAIVNAVKLDNCLELKRIPFLESLKRINIFAEDIFHTIQFKIENNVMILSSQDADFGSAKDEQNVNYSGPPLKLGFNCRYFIETLQVMKCEKVKAYINSNNSPCLIKSDDDKGFLSVIMPMQL